MRQGLVKNSFLYLLLALFFTAKMLVGVHIFTHDDDKGHPPHCTICDLALVIDHTPILSPSSSTISFESNLSYNNPEKFEGYIFIGYGKIPIAHLFSRPPPLT